MVSIMKYLYLFLFLSVAALGCGRFEDDDRSDRRWESASAPALPATSAVSDSSEEARVTGLSADAAMKPVAASDLLAEAMPAAAAPTGSPGNPGESTRSAITSQSAGRVDEGGETIPGGDVATLVQQQRIIVRTVDMSMVVTDVEASVDDIGGVAEEMGGWLVSSAHWEGNRGSVSIRVPAERLDEAILRLREMARDVKSEVTSSRDVTDEYFDIQARLTNLEATEDALIRLLDRAEEVEDALSIQSSLSEVQEDVERLKGRIKLLEQTAAFSLINVVLEPLKGEMTMDAGEDRTAGVDETVRFRATFTPPPDVEEFVYTWDFGDGSPPVSSDRTAPTENESTRVTATVTHAYSDERDSPYIAQIKMSGLGEGGEFEGEDTVIVTVSRAPVIEVFAGEDFSVEAGETVRVSGSFTRPSEIGGIKYLWDFGDGSDPVGGEVREGATSVVAEHVYQNHRPFPYLVRLTITAQSDAGDVRATSSVRVHVEEPLGWAVAGWSIGEQTKMAVRSLSAVGQGLVTFGIWFAIFTPVWAVVAVVVVIVWRRKTARPADSSDIGSDSER